MRHPVPVLRPDRWTAGRPPDGRLPQGLDYLDRFERPVGIVKTGCVRQQGNWAGDGQSTILFDRHAEFHRGSAVLSVDRDPEAAALCRSLVGGQVQIHAGHSLGYLKSLADHLPAGLEFLDLLCLDSFDLDFDHPLPSPTEKNDPTEPVRDQPLLSQVPIHPETPAKAATFRPVREFSGGDGLPGGASGDTWGRDRSAHSLRPAASAPAAKPGSSASRPDPVVQ